MLRTLAGSSAAILSSRWLNVQVLGFELQLCHCLPCDLGHGTSVCVPVSPSVTWFIRGLKTLKRVRYSAWVKGWKKIRLLLLLLFQAKSNKFDGISCFRFVVAAGAKGPGLGLNKRGDGVTLRQHHLVPSHGSSFFILTAALSAQRYSARLTKKELRPGSLMASPDSRGPTSEVGHEISSGRVMSPLWPTGGQKG